MLKYETANDLVYAVAKRARQLGDMTLIELRATAGYDCDTFAEAVRINKRLKRGELIELILTEEFIEDHPDYFFDETIM